MAKTGRLGLSYYVVGRCGCMYIAVMDGSTWLISNLCCVLCGYAESCLAWDYDTIRRCEVKVSTAQRCTCEMPR